MDDSEFYLEFVEEAREHLADIEIQLLQIEAMGEAIDDNLVNTVFRAIHSIKGAAGFLGLTQINAVSHRLENVLGRVRDKDLVPNPYNVDVMLKAADRLKSLIENIESSNETDNTELCQRLDSLLEAPVSQTAAQDAGNDSESSQGQSESMTTRKPTVKKTTTRRTSSGTRKTRAPRGQSTRRSKKTKDEVTQRVETTLDATEATLNAAESKTSSSTNASEAPAKPKRQPARRKSKSSKPGEEMGADSAPTTTQKASAPPRSASANESTIRVGVRVLDRLMNLAGELVLSRNQLLQALALDSSGGRTTNSSLDSIAAGLDQVTTELQESIMQTRMQPIGNVFNKFPRIIRDLSATLGKQIELLTEGNEVETDKTIVEAIADPLTHLIRNACDHGIEAPDIREKAGKPAQGTVVLKAYHQAGKVMIEIIDDGAGIDPAKLRAKAVEKGILDAAAADRMSDRDSVNLIFAPGFSTAAEITDVSGRGVGMDVVRTNIEKIGGSVEMLSQLGKGSTVQITLPLTLAIVPSMIVAVGDCRYALPQSSIVELVQTDGKDKCIQRANSAEVLRLRGQLLPLVRLSHVLNLSTKESKAETDDCQLVVVEAGRSKFAMAVDRVLDSEEIVVKPLGRHLGNLPLLAGATILGDGRVAMILDAAGIASRIDLAGDSEKRTQRHQEPIGETGPEDQQRLVLLSVGPKDRFAVSMDIVSRIERVALADIEPVGDQLLMQYRGGTLPLVTIDEVVKVAEVDRPDQVFVIVFRVYGHEVGLIAPNLHDIRDVDLSSGVQMSREEGVAGVAVIDDRSTRLLDLYGLTKEARPDWFEKPIGQEAQDGVARILVCEDSTFFRNFLTRTLTEEGHAVTACEHGEEGWSKLSEKPDAFDMLVTDVEMPELNGFELTRRIRADGRFKRLPIIALTSLADAESTRLGREAGVNDYQVKMNKPELLESIQRLIHTNTSEVNS